ncbi:MAG TPA: ABC transporter substrate-binding protein, partial [Verrucomicrobiae bacterium]
MNLRQLASAFVFILALQLMTGCSKKTDSGPAAADKNIPLPDPPLVFEGEPGIPGGTFIVSEFGDPKTFNPITENEGSSEVFTRLLFSGLLGFDWPSQKPLPGLAEKWSVADDKKTWTFKLRKNLKWSDGHPLTAEDVLFTFNDVVYNTNVINAQADLIRVDKKDFQITKLDDLTIQVVTPETYAPFAESFGQIPIVPKHILANAVAQKSFDAAYGVNVKPDDLVCNGPFKLKAHRAGEQTTLVRNPYFFEVDKKGQHLPYFDNIIYTVSPDMNTMALRFRNGESYALELMRPEDYEPLKAEAQTGKFDVLELGMALERGFFWFNQNTNMSKVTGKPLVSPTKLKWFRNVKFRQAMSYALDRDSIVKSIYGGRAKANFGYITEANPKWYNPNVKQYPFDQAKARALLKEIGIEDRNGDGFLEDADGNVIEFILNTNTGNDVRIKTSVLIQEDLKRLGIKLIFQPMEFNALISKI